MPRYFFHNGDVDELLASKPDDVIAIVFGLNEGAEYAPHLSVPAIPGTDIVVSYIPSIFTEVTDEDGKTGWVEFRFTNEIKPWSWDQVTPVVEVVPVEDVPVVPAVVEVVPVVPAVPAVVEDVPAVVESTPVVPEISPDVIDAEATA